MERERRSGRYGFGARSSETLRDGRPLEPGSGFQRAEVFPVAPSAGDFEEIGNARASSLAAHVLRSKLFSSSISPFNTWPCTSRTEVKTAGLSPEVIAERRSGKLQAEIQTQGAGQTARNRYLLPEATVCRRCIRDCNSRGKTLRAIVLSN